MKSQGRIPYRKVDHLLRFDFDEIVEWTSDKDKWTFRKGRKLRYYSVTTSVAATAERVMSFDVRKRGGHWYFGFQIRGVDATRLGDAGCNATTIARLLGHSNIQMSMRYTHASDDSLRSAVEHAAIKMPQTLKQPLTRVAVNT